MDQPADQDRSYAFKKSVINFVCGSLGGIGQVIVGQPFDIVKIRLQNQSLTKPVYDSAIQCASVILRKEGFMAFYKGTLAPLSTVPICTSVQFGVNGLNKKMLENYNRKRGYLNPADMSTGQYILAGTVAGMANSFVQAPVEHIRIVMQNQNNLKGTRGKYTGSFDALVNILRSHGLVKVYKGFQFTFLRNIVAFGIFFGYCETMKQRCIKKHGEMNLLKSLIYGGIGGILLWIPSYPIDV